MRRFLALLLLAFAACGRPTARSPVETVRLQAVELVSEADGELKSTQSTPLPVPGPPWSQRQLVWMVADGSPVKSGQLVARFAAADSQLQLDQAKADIQRNALAHAGKHDDLDAIQGRVDVDLSQVATDLGIARRYAATPLQMFARDKILDAVQDQHYLGSKQQMLEWKRGQSGQRAAAGLAVLDAQRSTFALNAKTLQQNLDALELTAPHDGVLMLDEDWSGAKAQVGANLYAGQGFASLPDARALEVELVVPQIDAQGVVTGDAVMLYPVGRAEEAITTRLSWVASAAQVRSEDSPAKYILMRATVPAAAALARAWVPGQRFHARIFVARARQGMTVPNMALTTESGHTYVSVEDGSRFERREVVLGTRGAVRSVVVSGLAAGQRILLLPPRGKGEGS